MAGPECTWMGNSSERIAARPSSLGYSRVTNFVPAFSGEGSASHDDARRGQVSRCRDYLRVWALTLLAAVLGACSSTSPSLATASARSTILAEARVAEDYDEGPSIMLGANAANLKTVLDTVAAYASMTLDVSCVPSRAVTCANLHDVPTTIALDVMALDAACLMRRDGDRWRVAPLPSDPNAAEFEAIARDLARVDPRTRRTKSLYVAARLALAIGRGGRGLVDAETVKRLEQELEPR